MADHQRDSDHHHFVRRSSRRSFLQALGAAAITMLAPAATHAATSRPAADVSKIIRGLLAHDALAQQAQANFSREGFRVELTQWTLVAHPRLAHLVGVRLDALERNALRQTGVLSLTLDVAAVAVRHAEQAVLTVDQTGVQPWAGVVALTTFTPERTLAPEALVARLSGNAALPVSTLSAADQAAGKREEFRYAIAGVTTEFRADVLLLTRALFARHWQITQPGSVPAWQPTGFVQQFERF